MAVKIPIGIVNSTVPARSIICGARTLSVQIVYTTAAPTAATTKLMGSNNDGSSWVELGSTSDVSATTVGFQVADKPYKSIGFIGTSTPNTCTDITGFVQWEDN